MKESQTTWERIFFSHKNFCIWLLSIKVHTNSVLIMMYFVKLTHLCFTCTKSDISMTRSHIAEDILHLAAYNLHRTQLVELECMHSTCTGIGCNILQGLNLWRKVSWWHPAWEYFTLIHHCCWRVAKFWPMRGTCCLSWGGSSLCHSDTGLWFMWSHLKDCPKLVAFNIKQGDSEDLF